MSGQHRQETLTTSLTPGGLLNPLGETGFRHLAAGQLVSWLGSAVAPVALAFAVLDVTGRPFDLGLVLGARAVAQVLFSLVGGVWADRYIRNRVMAWSCLLAGGAQGGLALLLALERCRLPSLLMLAALNGAASAVFFPAANGIIPQLVPHGQLQPANALLRLGLNASSAIGAAVGGLIVATAGSAMAFAVDGISYVLAAAHFAHVRLPYSHADSRPASIYIDVREGWEMFRSRSWLPTVVLQFSIINAAWAAGFTSLGPVIADRYLHGPSSWGVVLAANCTGLLVGGLVAAYWRPHRPLRAGVAATLFMAAPVAALGKSMSTTSVALLAFFAGIALEQFSVQWATAVQSHVPGNLLSRVTAYDVIGSFLFVPLGYVAAGVGATSIGVQQTIRIATLTILVAGVLALLNPEVRALPRQDLAFSHATERRLRQTN